MFALYAPKIEKCSNLHQLTINGLILGVKNMNEHEPKEYSCFLSWGIFFCESSIAGGKKVVRSPFCDKDNWLNEGGLVELVSQKKTLKSPLYVLRCLKKSLFYNNMISYQNRKRNVDNNRKKKNVDKTRKKEKRYRVSKQQLGKVVGNYAKFALTMKIIQALVQSHHITDEIGLWLTRSFYYMRLIITKSAL